MAIKNLDWELETTFTRKQVIAMSKLAEFVGNIEKDLTVGFPSSMKSADWKSVRDVMALFSELGSKDAICQKSLCKAVDDVNNGRVQLMCGKVVPASPFEVGDKVKCINRDNVMLNYGSEYTVTDCSTKGIRLEELPEIGFIEHSRFVRVNDPS